MRRIGTLMVISIVATTGGCAGVRSFFALDNSKREGQKPIQNPFGAYYGAPGSATNQSMILRTKKGDRAIEIEIPHNEHSKTDFVIPVSPAFETKKHEDEEYKKRPPTISDREITRRFQKGIPGSPDAEEKRQEIEQGLGLVPDEIATTDEDQSYLAATDHIKQLYKSGRYEAALIETDELVKQYPTDPKLHEMRGTLFDRLGKNDLAMQSWNQALRYDPANAALRRFIERKQTGRRPASP